MDQKKKLYSVSHQFYLAVQMKFLLLKRINNFLAKALDLLFVNIFE
jgi:hypothetical protein